MAIKRVSLAICLLALLIAGGSVLAQDDMMETTFMVRIENVSGDDTQAYSGIEIFAVPVGATEGRPAEPDEAYEFTVKAAAGDYLSFATMYGESNDVFFAPAEQGIALFDEDGNPVNGDVTDQMMLWDAGTEVNEPLGQGENQAPRQPAPNTGEAENGTVQMVAVGGEFPAVADLMTVTLTAVSFDQIRVRIDNHSDDAPVPTDFSPGVWVVHTADQVAPLFTAGEPDRGQGLEGIAEDGNPEALGAALAGSAVMDVGVSPGVFVVHAEDQFAPLFVPDSPDRGQGLERIAEDGNPAPLGEALAGRTDFKQSGMFDTAVDGTAPGPLMPGQAYEFTVTAAPGDRLSVAVMFGQSNDLFFAPGEGGIPLFMPDGTPVNGVVTGAFQLWDAGTEINQEPFVGPDQAPRQAAPDTGEAGRGLILPLYAVNDGFAYPSVLSSIRVTITPAEDMG